jgi:Ala-tRNA(Pro) deacylase
MTLQRLQEFLGEHKVRYRTIAHEPAITAQEIAAAAHIAGRNLAKTVMVKLDGRLAMAVVPATEQVNLDRLRRAAGASEIELASEAEFRDRFPDCEVGAMPPFGNLYGLDVFVADSLPREGSIAFNGGSHEELIELDYIDFERLVKPKRVSLKPH